MTDLVDQLRDAVHQAGQVAPPPPFEELKFRARGRRHRRTRALAAAAVTVAALVVAATLAWPPVSAPPADHHRPPKVADDRFLRPGDFFQPTFQAVEDVSGRVGHPTCPGTASGPGRTVQWREFRTFDQDVRGYQLVISYRDSVAARRGVRVVQDCAGMLTGDAAVTSQLTDIRGDAWRVRQRTARPRVTEVLAVTRTGNVVAAVWVRGLHRVIATDGYAQGILDRMRARLSGTSTRVATPPQDSLTAALLTTADARTLTGHTRVEVEYPAVYRSIHTCQPVPRSIVQWRHVHYQRHDWQPLLDERISVATDVAAATRSWQRLVTEITSCSATRERVVPGTTFGDAGVLITDTDDPSSPTAVVRVGRVLVELVLWDDTPQSTGPDLTRVPDFVTLALNRVREQLPHESTGG
jgi:hypothetical protein